MCCFRWFRPFWRLHRARRLCRALGRGRVIGISGVALGLLAYGLEGIDYDEQRKQTRDGYRGRDQFSLYADHEGQPRHDQEDCDEDHRLERLAIEKTRCYLVSTPSGDAI